MTVNSESFGRFGPIMTWGLQTLLLMLDTASGGALDENREKAVAILQKTYENAFNSYVPSVAANCTKEQKERFIMGIIKEANNIINGV